VPLNEYIDQYAPNIKRVLEERPEVKKNITSFDGNIYYIPHIPGGTVSTGWFIRNDWLKTLGLKAPETTEELYDTLVAFRNNDPNGNGIKDEIPYFNGAMTSGNFSGLECLYYLWNAFPSWYSDNGVVKYGPYEPNFKEAMMNLAQWYEEDLIDKEIFTRGSKARDKLLGDNVGGSTHDWFGSTALFNEKYKKLLRVLNFSLLHHLTELNLTIDPYLPHMAGQSVPVAKILFRRLNILISGLVKRAQG
jgi:putative aldouronate transport system substrate-binding protein